MEALDNNGYDGAPHAVFVGSLISPEHELPFLFIGIDIKQEKKIFRYHNFVEQGEFLTGGKFEIMLGVKGAKDLGVGIGDIVRLRTIIEPQHHLYTSTVPGEVDGLDIITEGYAMDYVSRIPVRI